MYNNSHQCSQIFSDVFDSHCGGCLRECCCGITHFDGAQSYDWGAGELEELRANAQKHPDKYVEHDCGIGTMEIDGREIVWGCSCQHASRYESFIRRHAKQLCEYLKRYSDELRQEADECTPPPVAKVENSGPFLFAPKRKMNIQE